MIKFNHLSLVVFLAAASLAHADTATKVPGEQGAASVKKNLEKDPDNKGLKNAEERHERNMERHKEQMEKRDERKAERHEMHENREHHERMEHRGK